MCVEGGLLGILRVGEAIWGRGDHDFIFIFSSGGGGWWRFLFDALDITIISLTFQHKLIFLFLFC
jgi:hypothetical protein